MTTFVALLRGINVGGHRKVPMARLRGLLESLGLGNVRSYIQSGNVVFETKGRSRSKVEKEIVATIEEEFGFAPKVMLLTRDELEAAARDNPYPRAEAEPGFLHLYFLESEPKEPDLDALDSLRSESESFSLTGQIFYLHTPEGIGRSKLAERVERCLGVPATARNWRTVQKLLEMTQRTEN